MNWTPDAIVTNRPGDALPVELLGPQRLTAFELHSTGVDGTRLPGVAIQLAHTVASLVQSVLAG